MLEPLGRGPARPLRGRFRPQVSAISERVIFPEGAEGASWAQVCTQKCARMSSDYTSCLQRLNSLSSAIKLVVFSDYTSCLQRLYSLSSEITLAVFSDETRCHPLGLISGCEMDCEMDDVFEQQRSDQQEYCRVFCAWPVTSFQQN